MSLKGQDITRLYRARKTLLEMLNDRGYMVIESELEMSKEQFIAKFGQNMKREDLIILKASRDDSRDQIYVFFAEDGSVNVKILNNYVSRMEQDNVTQAIIVVRQKLSAHANKLITEAYGKMYRIEVFQEDELQFNITKSVLVPKHELLTSEDKKDLLERYTADEKQLPMIQATDPVARYYGMKRGQVVKITRQSETSGHYVTYRYVV